MSKQIQESQATKLFKKLVNSEEFKKYHREQSLIRDVAVQIEKIRQQENLTQDQLADKMKVDQAVVSRMTRGTNFTLKTLEKFCLATDSRIVIVSNT
jgi:ribosome-binding protein aMBF1 (putative translation factor)